jgi:hypothetical protein
MNAIPPSTPIEETQERLGLRVSLPSHVRTAHDLLVALDRKEIDVSATQAKAIKEKIA